MRRGRPPYPDLLTPREQEVLDLIREGLTNEQIAARLGISESGARYHVSEILSKLGVSNRQEAASYSEEQQRRLLGLSLPFAFGRVHSMLATVAGTLPVIGLAAGLSTLLLLAVTLVVATSRGGQAENSDPSDHTASPIDEIPDLLRLAEEAQAEARVFLPDARLYLVAYATPSNLYTFRFTAEGTLNDVTLLGPYTGDAAFERWEVVEETRPAGASVPPPLDLTALQHMPIDVAQAASVQAPISPENAGVILWSEAGQLRWAVTSRSNAGLTRCDVADSIDLSPIACELPKP